MSLKRRIASFLNCVEKSKSEKITLETVKYNLEVGKFNLARKQVQFVNGDCDLFNALCLIAEATKKPSDIKMAAEEIFFSIDERVAEAVFFSVSEHDHRNRRQIIALSNLAINAGCFKLAWILINKIVPDHEMVSYCYDKNKICPKEKAIINIIKKSADIDLDFALETIDKIEKYIDLIPKKNLQANLKVCMEYESLLRCINSDDSVRIKRVNCRYSIYFAALQHCYCAGPALERKNFIENGRIKN